MTDTAWSDDAIGGVALGEAPPQAPSPAGSGEARLGRNILSLAGGQVITWTMTLLWMLVVPRALGPTGWGTVVSAL